MTVTTAPSIKDGCLVVHGNVVLREVPTNVVVSPVTQGSAFIGAASTTPSSRLLFSLGVLKGYKFMSIYRFKIWWMAPGFGKSGREVPVETQVLLLEAGAKSAANDITEPSSESTAYILFLPVLDGQFRTSLQGSNDDQLQICVESGDPSVQTSRVLEALFVNSGDNPYELFKNSIKILEKRKGTFSHVDNKRMPKHLDWFGWCTWDAFYGKVNPEGIIEGLQSFVDGGCPPKFLIIDDGWQDTFNEYLKEGELPTNCIQFATRLVDIKENKKFKESGSGGSCKSLCEFIATTKQKFKLKYVYMWHALMGYWGGLLPTSKALEKYNPKLMYPVLSPGNRSHVICGAMESLVRHGVGTIDPSKLFDFYDDLHSYIASCGADGVKVDIQNVVETLAAGYGGRVKLMKNYQKALEESVTKNFKDNNLICCMSQTTDYFYSSMKSASARASEDFMPNVPTIQTLHVATVAFNSLFLGEIVVPDWDMFHSSHITADFHAAARAIGGCAVYVSDKPGKQDFKILKRLVLPDGSILRAKYPGRPSRDCLFDDPVTDGKSLLKIWNLNKVTGMLGVFNCQGAGSWPTQENPEGLMLTEPKTSPISGFVSPQNVELLDEVAHEGWLGDCAVYAFKSGSLSVIPRKANLQVALGVLEYELYTVSPIRDLSNDIQFAVIGLLDMYNSGGAVDALDCTNAGTTLVVRIKGRGCGRFGAYSSALPKACRVNAEEKGFTYNPTDGLLTLRLGGQCGSKEIEIEYSILSTRP